ncbi:MAG: thiamine diphosphokinase [Spirochaetota bacterium]|jgi:thiamine pyrophosphokinase|nr:thiamine diphosphokinase [Spirochaetota bacterium]
MRAIIIGAGRPPKKSQLQFLHSLGYTCIVAADAGAQNAYRLHLRVSAVVGDFDSIPPAIMAHYRAQPDCEFAHYARQTDTDTEKCLRFLAERGCESCVLTAVTGDRLDHSLSGLALLVRWSSKMHTALISGGSIAEVAMGEISFNTTPHACISLYGFGTRGKNSSVGIFSEGLVYPLRGEPLVFGEFESQSNAASGDRVFLRISGSILVIREFREFQRHGFLSKMAD